ncbi:hypothetical protein ABTM13_19555, partial [Acinetobacter baumannii]
QGPSTTLLEAMALYAQMDDSAQGEARRLRVREEAGRLASTVSGLGRTVGGIVRLSWALRQSPPVLVAGPDAVEEALKLPCAIPVMPGS